MASYKEIFGTNIEVLASDPANPVAGQVWYNSTSNVVKGVAATTAGAWSTGGSLNTARDGLGGAGTVTAGLVFGGRIPPETGATESYDGTSWTEVNDLNTARRVAASIGVSSTAAIFATGYNGTVNVTNVESWDGTNWTEVNDVNTARRGVSGGGTSTSGIIAGGQGALVETWNGTCFSEVNDLNTPRDSGQMSATDSTAAIVYGGYDPGSATTITSNELWNGSSWTEVNDLNTARSSTQGVGTVTAGLVSAGYTDNAPVGNINPAATELWNGTSWSTDTAQPTPVQNLGAGGTSSNAFSAGGFTTTQVATTLEYLGAGAPLTVTFTDS